jgi:hypothetical protein
MKAERIGGEREGDLTDNFKILWILSNFIEICPFLFYQFFQIARFGHVLVLGQVLLPDFVLF